MQFRVVRKCFTRSRRNEKKNNRFELVTTKVLTGQSTSARRDSNWGRSSSNFTQKFPGILWPQEKVSKRSLEVDFICLINTTEVTRSSQVRE